AAPSGPATGGPGAVGPGHGNGRKEWPRARCRGSAISCFITPVSLTTNSSGHGGRMAFAGSGLGTILPMSEAAAPPFVHLRVHSEYSVVDGLVRIPDL